MTQPTNKFEQLLELLINEENDKAEQLFHEIVVEKSRDIYKGLADEQTATTETKEENKDEAKDEAKEDDKKDESVVKETEKSDEKAEDKKDEAVKETEGETVEDKDIKDEGVFTKPAPTQLRPSPTQVAPQKSDEESIEEIGGDATDELIKDISGDEEGEADAAADELGQDMGADAENGENGEDGSVEDRVVDLEDALDELKAEFEAMLAAQNGDGEAEEESLVPSTAAPVIPAETKPELSRFEGKDAKEDKKDAKEDKKETVKEYKNPVKADMSGGDDKSAKSPVNTKVKSAGGTTANIAKGGADEKGRTAPSAEKLAGSFENTGGKAKSTSFKKKESADLKDGSDKSAKSPVNTKA
jgi:hypothetical protein